MTTHNQTTLEWIVKASNMTQMIMLFLPVAIKRELHTGPASVYSGLQKAVPYN
jgi:hypothetical protein